MAQKTIEAEVKIAPHTDRIQLVGPDSFIDRLLGLSDLYEADGSHRAASSLRREIAIELLDQLNKRDEAKLALMAELKTPEIREQIDIGQTE